MRFWLVIVAVVLSASGCALHRQDPMIVLENPYPLPPGPPDCVWDVVVDVVDDFFEIEHEERGRVLGDVMTVGRIDTFPAVGSTLFEPWRRDSANGYERLESTLQSIRRRAVVQVIPAADGGSLVEVQVYKELEDVPTPESSPVASATLRYDTSLQTIAEPVGGQPVPLGWIGQGRDTALEQKILQRLSQRVPAIPAGADCKKPWWAIFSRQ